MMFIDEKDKLRKKYNIERKSAEACTARNHGQLCISMPALGEVYFKQREKDSVRFDCSFNNLNRLIDKNFFDVRFIDEKGDTFGTAKEIMDRSRSHKDERNVITPMDALILSMAIVDPHSSVFYTEDDKLFCNEDIFNIIDEYREKYDNKLEIRRISNLLR